MSDPEPDFGRRLSWDEPPVPDPMPKRWLPPPTPDLARIAEALERLAEAAEAHYRLARRRLL